MEEIFKLFLQDLGDIEKVIGLINSLSVFGQEAIPQGLESHETSFVKRSLELHKLITDGHQGSIKIPGTLLLYLGGRFEDFVKVLFEELSVQVANKYSEFKKLPTSLQQALIVDTSEVISNPRRYGHGDEIREIFIKTLSDNIHSNNLSLINYKCLSITSSNMRPEIIKELFSKVGLQDIWKKIGEQAKIKMHFATENSQQAENNSRKYLENFMETRNKIAHPSGSFSWPSTRTLIEHINFFKSLGNVLLEISQVYLSKIIAENFREETSLDSAS